MKKKVMGRKLGRERDTRRALFRQLIKALFQHGGIKTTHAKAKSVQNEIDKLLGLAKTENREAKRLISKRLANDRKTTGMVFKTISERFSGINSGFTRIIPLPPRFGDNAKIVRLEWSREAESISKKSKSKKNSSKKFKVRERSKESSTLKSKIRRRKKESEKSVKKK